MKNAKKTSRLEKTLSNRIKNKISHKHSKALINLKQEVNEVDGLQEAIAELGARLTDDLSKEDKTEEGVDTTEYSSNIGQLTTQIKNLN